MKSLSTAICAVGAAFGLSVSASAGNVSFTWNASADPMPTTMGDAATGLLEFTYDPGDASLVSNITARPVDGGTIVLKGDQINVCTLSHIIMAAGGELVFSNAVKGAANIYCESTSDSSERTISYSGANFDTEYKTIFANRNLSDWMPYSTGNANGMGWWKTDNIKTYNIRHETDGSITAQRQGGLGKVDGVDRIASVKFQLKQVGNDIAGRVIHAVYWASAKGPIGTDSDEVIANPDAYAPFTDSGVSTPTKNSGYGINKITMYRVKGLPTVRFAGGLDIVQVLYAREFTHVIYERAVTGSAQIGYQADANGILTFRDPEYLFDPSSNAARTGPLSYGIKGAGTVEFEATDTLYGDEHVDTDTVSYAGWIPTTWVTVAEGQQLANLISASALFGGYSMDKSWRGTSEGIKLLSPREDGQEERTGQFHYLFGGWIAKPTINRCAAFMVKFRQNGSNVDMCVVQVRCNGGNGTPAATVTALYGTDLSSSGSVFKVGTSDTDDTANYGIHDISLTFRSSYNVKLATMGRYQGIRAMAGSSSVPGCKAQLIVKGTDNTKMRYLPAAGNGHVLPYTDGLLRVQNGGDVVHQMSGRTSASTMWVDDRALIYIEQGGVFRQQANWGMGVMQRVDIAGGEYRVRDIASVTSGQCAFNLLTFSGATLLHSANDGDFVCAGATNGVVNAIWNVRGTAASTCDIALRLWTASSGGTMTFAVNDVASGSDFVMNGAVDVNPQFPNVAVYKTGSGMMQLNASYNISGRPTLLTDGTWLLNGSSLTSASDPYTIDGGTLAVADGTANDLGVLTVGATGGGITLGAGATLTFADSSAAEWTGDVTNRVIVTGFAEKSIRFGTTRNGLATAQRVRLRTSDDKRLFLDADGYLTTTGPGTVFSFR